MMYFNNTICGSPDAYSVTYTDRKFIISDDILISGTNVTATVVIFEGCELMFDASTVAEPQIIIEDEFSTLNINNDSQTPSRLFACGDMWGGIENIDGGYVNIYPGGGIKTEISDATIAISSESGRVDIRSAIFDRNHIGLQLNNGVYYNGDLDANHGLIGIDFKCTDGQILKDPHANEPTESHIVLTGIFQDSPFTNIQIGSYGSGNPQAYTNTFSNAIYGIRTINSQPTVINCEFEDMISVSLCNPCGSAIYAENTGSTLELIVGGDISTSSFVKNYFKNARFGVLTKGDFNVTIQGNEFVDLHQGIRTNKNHGDAIINGENTFNGVRFGITAFNIWGEVTIHNNEFNLDPATAEPPSEQFYRTAITIQNPSVRTNASDVYIYDNEITDYRIGIHSRNMLDMHIGQDANDDLFGNTLLYHVGNGTTLGNVHTGIWLENSAGAFVKDNKIENEDGDVTDNTYLFRGIVANNSQYLNICGNELTNYGTAMVFEGDCEFTEFKNNIMTDYFTGIHFEAVTFSDQGAMDEPWDNQWIHNTNTSLLKVDEGSPSPDPFNFNWYFQDDELDLGNAFSPYPYDPNAINAIEQTYGDPIVCEDETSLSASIDRDINYGPLVADTITYYENHDNYRYLARVSLFKKLSENPSLISISSPLDSVFAAFYDEMRMENTGRFDSVQVAINTNNLVDADALNESIDDDNGIEANTKLINSILINKIEEDIELDYADSTALETIFEQHWNVGGLSVYNASAMLFKEYYTTSYSLRVQTPVSELVKPILPKKDLGIYPNPSKGKIFFNRILSPTVIIKLFDASGRLIVTGTNSYELDINGVEDGFYVLKVYENENDVYFKNVVIIN